MLRHEVGQPAVIRDGRAAIRRERDARIAATDWTQLADVPPGTAYKWASYRQALRDVTQSGEWDIARVNWPDPPA